MDDERPVGRPSKPDVREEGDKKPKIELTPKKVLIGVLVVIGVLLVGGIGLYKIMDSGKDDVARSAEFTGTWAIQGSTNGDGIGISSLTLEDPASSVLGIVGNSAQLTENGVVTDYVFEFDGTECTFRRNGEGPGMKGSLQLGKLIITGGSAGGMRVYEKHSDVYPPEEEVSSSGSGSVTPFQESTAQDSSAQSQTEPVPAQQPETPYVQPQVQETPAAPAQDPSLQSQQQGGDVAAQPQDQAAVPVPPAVTEQQPVPEQQPAPEQQVSPEQQQMDASAQQQGEPVQQDSSQVHVRYASRDA